MGPYLTQAILLLMVMERSLAIDFTNLKFSALTTEDRAERDAKREQLMARWEEAVANITADLEELEALKDTGFPTVITDLVTDTPSEDAVNTEGSATTQEEIFTGKPTEFSCRTYAGYLRNREGDDVSGLCASRVHPGILYYVNDGSDADNRVYVIDSKNHGQTISKITLNVDNVDWEDMACGPCSPGSLEYCIYILDAGSSGPGPVNKLYIFKEPEDISRDQDAEDVVTISFSAYTRNCETLMVSPSGRIFIMDSTEDSFPLYEVVDGRAKYLFKVKLWSYYEGPKGADISPDGKGFLFKMEDRVYYFYVEEEDDMESVMTSSSNRQKFPYLVEYYGTSIAWSHTGGSFFTVSEGKNEPLYQYNRLK
ncbi:uncharacterized protein [Haliotis asinina]|uniref:uncharacterized protein n=1 Tax=Haliotis asinina TaxID=109174 RepID=UPI0035320EDC